MQPGSLISPQGTGPSPDDDKNPGARRWANEDSRGYSQAGIDQAGAFANDPNNASGEESSAAELESKANPSDGSSTSVSKDESDLIDNEKYINSTTASPQKRGIAGQLAKRRKQAAAAAAGISVTIAVIGGIVAAPGLILNYVSSLINGEVGRLQNHQMKRFHRSKMSRLSDKFSTDGRKSGPIIKEMESRGYKFVYDDVDSKVVRGIQKPGEKVFSPASTGAAWREVSDFIDKRHPFLSKTKWKTKRAEAFMKRNKINTRAITANPATGPPENPEVHTNKEMNNRSSGVDTETDAKLSIDGEIKEEDLTDEQKANLANSGEIAQEADELKRIQGKLADGIPIDELDALDRELLEAVGQLNAGKLSGEALEAAERAATRGGFKMGGFLKNLTVSGTYSGICTLRKRINQGFAAGRIVAQAAFLRLAFAFISADDGVRKREAAIPLVREVVKRVTSKDSSGSYFNQSEGFKFASKGRFSKAKNDSERGTASIDGKKDTGAIGNIEKGLARITEDNTCAIANNPLTQVAEGVGTILLSVFGGEAAIAQGATVAALKTAVKEMVTELIAKGIVKTVVKEIAKSVLVEITLQGTMTLVQMFAQSKLTLSVTGQEVGAEFSKQLISGGGSANKSDSLETGMVPATTVEYAQAYNVYLAERKEDMKDKSLFARLFDKDDIDSLSFALMGDMPFSVEQSRTMAVNAPGLINPANMVAQLSKPFTKTALAASNGDEIAFDTLTIKNEKNDKTENFAADPYGNFLPIMRSDIAGLDENAVLEELSSSAEGGPHINKETLEVTSDVFKKHLENCTDNLDVAAMVQNGDRSKPEEDCTAELDITKKFKAFLAYRSTIDRRDSDFGLGTPSTEDSTSYTTTPVNITGLSGPTIPCKGQPQAIRRGPQDSADWSSIVPTGSIGTNVGGNPINVYVRNACVQENVKTVVIGASIHGSENGGQLVAQEMLFNAVLPDNVRVIAIPKICDCAGTGNRSANKIDGRWLDLNRDYDFNWSLVAASQRIPSSDPNGRVYYKGPAPESQPETKAVVNFMKGLGRVELFVMYHDSLNYVAPVGSTSNTIASTFAGITGMHGQCSSGSSNASCPIKNVSQKGSLDGWFNKVSGSPTILVEWYNGPSETALKSQAEAIKAVVTGTQ